MFLEKDKKGAGIHRAIMRRRMKNMLWWLVNAVFDFIWYSGGFLGMQFAGTASRHATRVTKSSSFATTGKPCTSNDLRKVKLSGLDKSFVLWLNQSDQINIFGTFIVPSSSSCYQPFILFSFHFPICEFMYFFKWQGKPLLLTRSSYVNSRQRIDFDNLSGTWPFDHFDSVMKWSGPQSN